MDKKFNTLKIYKNYETLTIIQGKYTVLLEISTKIITLETLEKRIGREYTKLEVRKSKDGLLIATGINENLYLVDVFLINAEDIGIKSSIVYTSKIKSNNLGDLDIFMGQDACYIHNKDEYKIISYKDNIEKDISDFGVHIVDISTRGVTIATYTEIIEIEQSDFIFKSHYRAII